MLRNPLLTLPRRGVLRSQKRAESGEGRACSRMGVRRGRRRKGFAKRGQFLMHVMLL